MTTYNRHTAGTYTGDSVTVPARGTVTAPTATGSQEIHSRVTPESMAELDYFPRADRPDAPGENCQWQPADPAYTLVDGVSVPSGEWVPIEPPDTSERDACIAAIRAVFTALGIDPIPPDWATAIAAIEALPPSLERTDAALKLMALNTAMIQAGGTWAMVIAE